MASGKRKLPELENKKSFIRISLADRERDEKDTSFAAGYSDQVSQLGVVNGEIDAVVVDSTVADGFVAKNPDKYEKAFSDKTEPEEFGIAIGKNNAKLQEAINKALEQMDKDGFLKDTADYWFSSQE